MAEHALREARAHNSDAAEVAVSARRGFSLSVRDSDLETIEHINSRSLSVTVYRDQRQSSASTSLLSRDSVSTLVGELCGIVRHVECDPCAGLAPAELMAADEDNPDLQIDYAWDVDTEMAKSLAIECEQAMRAVDKVRQTDHVNVETSRS